MALPFVNKMAVLASAVQPSIFMIIASADSTWTNVFDLPLHQRYAAAPDEHYGTSRM
jgi:hypothetical protein